MRHTLIAASHPVRLLVSAALLFSVVGLAAVAPQPSQRARPAQPPPPAPPLLRGPEVQETGIPGTERSFTMDGPARGPQERQLNREIPMNEFMDAFRALNAQDTPQELHLRPDQRQQLADIVLEHASSLRAHMQANRAELEAIGQTLGFDPLELQRGERAFGQRLADGERRAQRAIARGPDAAPPQSRAGDDMPPPPPADAAPDRGPSQSRPPRSPEQLIRQRVGDNPTPAQRAALDRLREIRDAGPSPLDAQTRAWNLLDQPQQEFVQARLGEARQRLQAQRGEMYVQEMVERGNPEVPPVSAPGSAAERLHRIIDELSPQEQNLLLRLIENRLQQRRAGQRPAQPDAGERRPPPPPANMNDIAIPRPDPI